MQGLMRSWAYRIIPAGGVIPAFSGTTNGAIPLPPTDGDGKPTGTVVIPMVNGDEKLFKPVDRVFLWRVANTSDKPDAITTVISIDTVGHTITVQSYVAPATALASGDWVILAVDCTSAYFEVRVSNQAATMGIGVGPQVSLGGANPAGFQLISAALVLTPAGGVPSNESISDLYGANPGSTAQFWIVGTANDQFLPSILLT